MKVETKRLLYGMVQGESLAIAVALALLLVAMLMPPFNVARTTWSYIVFFDITQSMNVEDYEIDGRPASRLAYARYAFREALRELPCGSSVGLGIFTEYRTLLLMTPIEVCDNYHELLVSLGYIDGKMRWRDSSEVTKGVFWSIRASKELGQDSRVVFLTDGHEAPPLRRSGRPNFSDIEPGEVPGWLIGVGGYTPRPIPRTDGEGNQSGYWRAEDVVQSKPDSSQGSQPPGREHLSGLREAHLQALAQQVGFNYARLSQPASLRDAMLDRRYAERKQVPTDLSWLPASIALLLLALRFRPDIAQIRRVRAPWKTRRSLESKDRG